MSVVGLRSESVRSRCVVLVPASTHVMPDCERSLVALEGRGYVVRRVYGQAAIDQARSQMATDALADGFDELMWIDADVGFDPDAVAQLRALGLPMVCAIYPKKGQRALACNLLGETTRLAFGEHGGVCEIAHAATGFLLTHRRVYEDVARACALPICNQRHGRPIVPYFLPMVVEDGEGSWYLGEDFAFSERARKAGHAIMADTRIRLHHLGIYPYSWEDAGGRLERFARYDFRVQR